MNKKDRNLMGALAYLFGWITGFVIFLVEKKDKFVRFHAIQSIMLSIAIFVVAFVLMLFNIFVGVIGNIIPGLGCLAAIIGMMFGMGILVVAVVLSLFMMYQAYEGRKYKLPIIGDMAEKQA